MLKDAIPGWLALLVTALLLFSCSFLDTFPRLHSSLLAAIAAAGFTILVLLIASIVSIVRHHRF